MAKRVIAVFMALAYWGVRSVCRAVSQLVNRSGPERRLVVLTYHSVAAGDSARFEQQMRRLREQAVPVFADAPMGSTGRQTVAVTFDDALQCVFDVALPILARLEVPATIFVPTGFLGTRAGWVRAEDSDKFGGAVVSSATLARVDERWIRIASHTVSHVRLATLRGQQLDEELMASRLTLEGLTGSPVRILSLPYGSFDAGVVAAAHRTGYKRVFANVPLLGRASEGSLLAGRIDVSPRDWPIEFRLKSRGAYEWLALAIPVKRALSRAV